MLMLAIGQLFSTVQKNAFPDRVRTRGPVVPLMPQNHIDAVVVHNI